MSLFLQQKIGLFCFAFVRICEAFCLKMLPSSSYILRDVVVLTTKLLSVCLKNLDRSYKYQFLSLLD